MAIGGRCRTKKRNIDRAKARAKALELRVQQKSIRAIAKEIGYSSTETHKLLEEAIAEIPLESRNMLIAEQRDIYRRVLEANINRLHEGDSAKIVMQALKQSADLLGLEADKRQVVEIDAQTTDAAAIMAEVFRSKVLVPTTEQADDKPTEH
jgi:predicted regulator of amino acid metabolism with ACT domain